MLSGPQLAWIADSVTRIPVTACTDLLQPTHRFEADLEDGATVSIRVYGDGPRLIASHGNGLAIDAYRSFWSRFAHDHQVVVLDFRHHGQSSPYKRRLDARPLDNWAQFVRDFDRILATIGRRLGARPSAGAFHSMSSLTALLHAARYGADWRGLVAFEPPVPPPPGKSQADAFVELHTKLARRAAHRRETFAAVEELSASFAKRHAFSRLDDDARRQLAAATLRWDPARQLFELACAREFEAETFRMHGLESAWGEITGLSLPVCIVSSDPATSEMACLAVIAESLAIAGGYRHYRVNDSTHFLQLEHAQECASVTREFLQSID